MSGSLEYAQARVQSGHGMRPGPAAWSTLHAATTQAALLDAARAGPLHSWVAGLESGAGLHDIERLLRQRLRERIAEVARWMPAAWAPAVLWTRALLDLPALQRLALGGSPRPWMEREPSIAARAREPPDADRALAMRQAWIEHWRRLWPPCTTEDREALGELQRTVEAHLEAFARAAPDDAASLRLALQARVGTLFRRHALGPAAAFDHLMLCALDLERLRAELVAHTRAASAAPPGKPT